MLKIGDFSKLARISIRMLRYYDEIGLLMPESIDKFTGYRYYSEFQLPLANRINALKNMGFSLIMIRDILKDYDNTQKFKEYLNDKQNQLQQEIQEINNRITLIKTIMSYVDKEDESMKYDVTVKELPEMYVASVRKVIPYYNREGMLWEILMKETEALNLQASNPCYTLAIFHDGEFKESDVDVEVQKSVIGKYNDTENVKFKTMPKVQIASSTYKGSYDNISKVNEAVANWIKENGYEFDGLSFSIYHVSPHETSNPDEFVTEVCYPVKKVK